MNNRDPITQLPPPILPTLKKKINRRDDSSRLDEDVSTSLYDSTRITP